MFDRSHLKARLLGLSAAACLGLGAAGAVHAQSYDGSPGYYGDSDSVTVFAPRHHFRRLPDRDDATGAPIETISASRVVYFNDLDLSSPIGQDRLRARLIRAAGDACTELDNDPGVTQDITDGECVSHAVRRALYDVYGD